MDLRSKSSMIHSMKSRDIVSDNNQKKKKRVRFRTARESNLRSAYNPQQQVDDSSANNTNNNHKNDSKDVPVVNNIKDDIIINTTDNDNVPLKLSFWNRYKGTIVLVVVISLLFICITVVYFINKHRRSKLLPSGVRLTNNYVDEFGKNLNEFDYQSHR